MKKTTLSRTTLSIKLPSFKVALLGDNVQSLYTVHREAFLSKTIIAITVIIENS